MSNLEDCTVAVQMKGRLTENSIRWLNENTGSGFAEQQKPFGPTRELYDTETGIRLFGCSNGVLQKVVARGLVDVAISGADTFYESVLRSRVQSRRNLASLSLMTCLGFSPSSLVIGKPINDPECRITSAASTYPNLAAGYFEEVLGTPLPFDIEEYSGGVESVARRAGDTAVIDLCETGNSLRRNGWLRCATVLDSEAVLFGRGEPTKTIPYAPMPNAEALVKLVV